jgi:site-specific DNA-methyltransferase (adenine-specific)
MSRGTTMAVGDQIIVVGDALTELKKLGDGTIDVVVTSPPYNLKIRYNTYDDNRPRHEYLAWLGEIGAQLRRVLRPGGSVFLNVGSTSKEPWVAMDVANVFRAIFVLQNQFVWVKAITVECRPDKRTELQTVSCGHFKPIPGTRYVNNCHEAIFHFTPTGDTPLDRLAIGVPFQDESNIKRWGHASNLRCRGNTWAIHYKTVQTHAENFNHPAGFPVELPTWCLKLHEGANLTVLDPFLGTGTTLIAARRLGHRGIGFEIDPQYAQTAVDRLYAESEETPVREKDLFGTPAPPAVQATAGLLDTPCPPTPLYYKGEAPSTLPLPKLLARAAALGARFRLSGTDIESDGLDGLPSDLQAALLADLPALWSHLGGGACDQPSLKLADRLGIEIRLVETVAEARAAVRQLIRQISDGPGHLAVDIETAPRAGCGAERPWIKLRKNGALWVHQPTEKDPAPLCPYRGCIGCLQLCADLFTAFVFRGPALDLVVRSHWLRRQHLVAHNTGFELAFLKQSAPDYRRPPDRRSGVRLECTMQATGLLQGVWNRGLDDACKSYLGITLSKELQTSDWSAETLSPGQLAYAALDAAVTWRLWPVLRGELVRSGRWDAYVLQSRAIPAMVAMELRGLGIDRGKHARLVEQWSRELADARQAYLTATGQPPPSKPAEVRAWLATVLSADEQVSWPRTKTGALSIETKYLKRLALRPGGKPVLDLLAREKLLQCFGPTLVDKINPVTGRLHCRFVISGSKAGRFTATNPNLQQLPSRKAKEFRECIVAAEGCVVVGCDWNQVELRAIAWVSGDPALTAVYAEGRDLHQENAANFARVPLEEVTEEQRTAAKPVSFGWIYGIGAISLAEDAFANYGVEMTVAEAQERLDGFSRRFPRVAAWRDENAGICRAQGFVRIGCGRIVEAKWEPYNKLSFPQCCNLPIQGICADAMLRAIPLAHKRLCAAGIRGGLVATVHDELLAEVVETDAERARDIIQETMVNAFATTFPGAPLNGVAEAKTGRSWSDLK